MIERWSIRLCVFLAVVLLAGCAAGLGEFKRGEEALQQGDYQLAVASLLDATEKAPDNHAYKLRLSAHRPRPQLDRLTLYFYFRISSG